MHLSKRGFTLLECVAAASLLVLGAGLGLSWLGRTLDDWRLQGAAQALGADLTRARGAAVSTGAAHRILVHPAAESYAVSVDGGPPRFWTSLPHGVRIIGAPSRPLIFYSRGQAAPAGTYLLEGRAGRVRVIVAPMGRVRWEWDQ